MYIRRKKMKKLLAILLALAMVLSFAACGEKEAAPAAEPAAEGFQWNGQKEVWSILPTTGAEGLNIINDSMGAVMEAQGFTYVKKDAAGDPTKQVTFVEDAIAAGNVGALMIAAMSVDMLQDVVAQAIDAGIAVAMLGADPSYEICGNVYTAYEITGMFAVQSAEDWVQKRVAEGGNVPQVDGKYEVACDVYTDIQDGVYRSNAIVGTVDDSSVLTRVATTSSYGESAYDTSYKNAQDVLGAHPNCRIFIAYEPEEAMGAAAACADFAEQNNLDLADFCVMPCYAEDTTFTEMYTAAADNHSANAIKGYSSYGDAPEMRNGEVIIPPVLTGEHLADLLLSACGIDGYTWTYGETYYDTVTTVNVYGFEKSWKTGEANPAIDYKNANFSN